MPHLTSGLCVFDNFGWCCSCILHVLSAMTDKTFAESVDHCEDYLKSPPKAFTSTVNTLCSSATQLQHLCYALHLLHLFRGLPPAYIAVEQLASVASSMIVVQLLLSLVALQSSKPFTNGNQHTSPSAASISQQPLSTKSLLAILCSSAASLHSGVAYSLSTRILLCCQRVLMSVYSSYSPRSLVSCSALMDPKVLLLYFLTFPVALSASLPGFSALQMKLYNETTFSHMVTAYLSQFGSSKLLLSALFQSILLVLTTASREAEHSHQFCTALSLITEFLFGSIRYFKSVDLARSSNHVEASNSAGRKASFAFLHQCFDQTRSFMKQRLTNVLTLPLPTSHSVDIYHCYFSQSNYPLVTHTLQLLAALIQYDLEPAVKKIKDIVTVKSEDASVAPVDCTGPAATTLVTDGGDAYRSTPTAARACSPRFSIACCALSALSTSRHIAITIYF